ncbi:MAG: DUF1841 family protein [Gammaproteobacteria bacterium]|jgi:hypothetical protein|nr:DUF1841 family protein [Gammaproteobacteria bacterium]
MWSHDRLTYRHYFYAAWQKAQAREILTPLESEIVEMIVEHPEYHFIFEDESLKERDYFPELGDANPFLHLSLHLGLCEQLATNRPQGIRDIYTALLERVRDPHETQHVIMERIAEMMHQARQGRALDDARYLLELKSLIY